MDNNNKVFWSIPLAIIGALFLIWSMQTDTWARDILLVVGLVLTCAAFAIVLVWFLWHLAELRRYNRTTDAISADERIIEARTSQYRTLSEMPAHVLQYIEQVDGLSAAFDILDDEPVVYGTNKVPWWFLVDFLEKSDDDFLCPRRTWSDGSKERRWAEELTRLFIHKGWATELRNMDGDYAGGNTPARWKPKVYEVLRRRVLEQRPEEITQNELAPLPH